MKFSSVPMILVCFLNPLAAYSEILSLEAYIQRVEAAHDGFKASRLKAEGFELQAKQGRMLLLPYLTGKAGFLSDEKENSNPTFQGTKTRADQYSLGVSELTPVGVKARIAYEITSVHLFDTSPQFVPLSEYYEARPIFELTGSLWRNLFGSETRAQINAIESKALAASATESFKSKRIQAAAEAAYWKTRMALKVLTVRKNSLERATQLRAWAARRVNLQLADKSDLLQAESAMKGKKFEYEKSLDDSKSAIRDFNSLQGEESDELLVSLMETSAAEFSELKIPERASLRDDTKAALQMSVLNESNAQLAKENGRPTLEVTASAALNGRNAAMGDAIDNSFSADHPTYSLGVIFSTPLDFLAAHSLRTGAEKERMAAELEYKRKHFEQEQDWKNLTNKFEAARTRLALAREFEEAEGAKVKHERERLQRGRTTTFQVLLFEQDSANATLNRLQSEVELLSLHAELKTFR